MKQINKIVIIGALLTAAFVSGCKKSWFDINKDPNNPVESNITPDLVAPAALLNTANRVGTGFGFLANYLGFWAPGANYAPNTEEQSYNITTNFGAGLFTGIMDNSYDYQFMQERSVILKQDFFQGIARIMKSHNFAQLVDLYDKVPYFEALQGIRVLRPKYDEGRVVYEDLIKQIDTAITLIKDANISENLNLTTADIMFHGDKTLWVKFANTLKLRLLMHQVNRADRQAYVQAEIAKIQAEGTGFLGSGEDADVNPGYTQDKPNAFYASYGFTQTGNQATDFWRANIVAVNYYKNMGDTLRLRAFYKPIVNAVPAGAPEPFPQLAPQNIRGNQYGLGINNVTYPYQTANYVSQVGGIATAGPVTASSQGLVKGFNQDAWILTSVESLFLQAEAIERGFLPGDKKQAFKNAIQESFIWLNIGGSRTAAINAFNTYYNLQEANANIHVSYDHAGPTMANKLRTLMFQKYLALNGIAFLEIWNDYRRYTGGTPQTDPDLTKYAAGNPGTGSYPYLDLSQNPGRTAQTLIQRLLFPQVELNLNTANVPQEGRRAGDQFTVKVWWMP